MEKKLAAQALGSQKPSEMLHGHLVQFCTVGESQTRIFFRYLFLQRLPTEIRMILAEDRDSKLPALAARADQFCGPTAPGRRSMPPSTQVVEEDRQEPPVLAAVPVYLGLYRFHWQYGEKAYSCQPSPAPGREN
jgi:hypothetical protein